MSCFALVDANNFYASCEQLFDPRLRQRPVVVLSNNDGCVVSRSAEARALGTPMGIAWHQYADQARRLGIVALSSNYPLYADLSNRVVALLGALAPEMEVYSIDESFLDLTTLPVDRENHGQLIRQRIASGLGLAVCVGIGPSKTLAKLANHCAKKQLAGHDGVCDYTALSPAAQRQLLQRIPVAEVWGIGRRLSGQLARLGITTAGQLRDADPESLRQRFSVVMERTIRELRGVSCLELEDVAPPRQQILSSRSFGRPVFELEDLEQAVVSYISLAAEKLRAQGSLAGALGVSLRTSPFLEAERRYQASCTLPLPEASSDSRNLAEWGRRILRRLYRNGYAYQKAGVLLCDLR
ncbi:MAG: repair protein, partial [Pseudomonadota bacterium]